LVEHAGEYPVDGNVVPDEIVERRELELPDIGPSKIPDYCGACLSLRREHPVRQRQPKPSPHINQRFREHIDQRIIMVRRRRDHKTHNKLRRAMQNPTGMRAMPWSAAQTHCAEA
jgi:hypothetical protein